MKHHITVNGRRVLAVFLGALLILLTASPVLAYLFSANITVTNSGVAYSMLPLTVTMSNSNLVTQGYILSSGLDVRAETQAGSEMPVMLAADRTLYARAVGATSTYTDLYTTGNTAASAMSIVLGNGGYITRADDAALEPGSSFSLATPGYFDTDYVATVKTHYYKTGALKLITAADNTLTAVIDANTTKISQVASTNTIGFTGNWQTFTTDADGIYLSRVTLSKSATVGSPVGYMTIQTTAAGAPTGTIVATSGTGYDSSGLHWDFSPVYLSPNTQYAFVAGGYDGGNRWDVHYSNADPYADGRHSQNAAYDLIFYVKESIYVTAAGVTPGAHTPVTVSHSGAQLSINVDGVTTNTATAVAIPNNGNSWVFMGAYTPYLTSISLTVSGTEVLKYQPVTVISGTTMPDRAGAAQDGTITWGSNPAGITATIAGFSPSGSSSGAGTDDTTDHVPDTHTSGAWYAPDATALSSHFLYPIVSALAAMSTLNGARGFNEIQVWCFFALAFVAGMMILAWRVAPGHTGVLGFGMAFGACIVAVLGIWPWFMIVLMIIGVIFGLVTERSPSV